MGPYFGPMRALEKGLHSYLVLGVSHIQYTPVLYVVIPLGQCLALALPIPCVFHIQLGDSYSRYKTTVSSARE